MINVCVRTCVCACLCEAKRKEENTIVYMQRQVVDILDDFSNCSSSYACIHIFADDVSAFRASKQLSKREAEEGEEVKKAHFTQNWCQNTFSSSSSDEIPYNNI